MSEEAFKLVFTAAMLAVVFLLAGCWSWVSAYNEAATYRRLTGKEVTTWDALWVDLRVQESVNIPCRVRGSIYECR